MKHNIIYSDIMSITEFLEIYKTLLIEMKQNTEVISHKIIVSFYVLAIEKIKNMYIKKFKKWDEINIHLFNCKDNLQEISINKLEQFLIDMNDYLNKVERILFLYDTMSFSFLDNSPEITDEIPISEICFGIIKGMLDTMTEILYDIQKNMSKDTTDLKGKDDNTISIPKYTMSDVENNFWKYKLSSWL